jgi:hypothetical protein
MKTHLSLYVLLVALLTGNTLSGQNSLRKGLFDFQFPLGFSLHTPVDNRMPEFDRLISGGMSIAYFPKREVPLGVEVRGTAGTYGSMSETRTFTVEGRRNTEVEIKMLSQMHQLLVGATFANPTSERRFSPFASVHLGGLFFQSYLRVDAPGFDDKCPETEDGDRNLEDRQVYDFKGWAFSGEAGVEVLLSRDISGKGEHLILSVSGSLLRSFRDVEYINVEHLLDEVPVSTINGSTLRYGQVASGSPAQEAMSEEYIHISAQNLPYRKVAEVHRAPLHLIGFNTGLIVRF